MNFYLSSGAFRTKSLKEIVSFSVEHGLDRIELSSGLRHEANLLQPVRDTNGVSVNYLVHNYFPPPAKSFVLNLAASKDEILELSCNLCKTAIDLAVELGAPFYSVHSGFAVNLSPELLGKPEAQALLPEKAYISYSAAYDRFVETVKSLTEYAKTKNVKLLIENNVVSPLYLKKHEHNPFLMASPDEIVRFMEDVNDSNLGLLVDVGHANVSATALGFDRDEFVEKVSPYICAFHLSGNDGQTDQNLPFDRDAWFCKFLPSFANLTWVIEAYKLSLEQINQQHRVLEEILS